MKSVTIEITETEAKSLISVLQHEHEALTELVFNYGEDDFIDQLRAVHNVWMQLKKLCEVT